MASDPFARRTFSCSLLASLLLHVLVVVLLMVFWRSVTFGPGNSTIFVAGTWGAVPEPEVFIESGWLASAEASDSLPGDNHVALAKSSDESAMRSVSESLPLVEATDSPADDNDMAPEESYPQPEVLSLGESLDPTDSDTSQTGEHGQALSSSDAIEAEPPELAALSVPPSSRGSTNRGPVAAQGASFFGTAAEGDRFVYLVDNSPSMNIGRGRGAGDVSRLVRALGELKSSIERLSPDQSFYVILFNGQARRMFDENAKAPQPLPATPYNKRRLEKWLASVGTGDATDPRPALQLGLAMRPNAVFLLSDGVFNVKEAALAEFIDRHNVAGTPIHTIAYEDERSCQTMERIAYLTGGEYRFVESPLRTREDR
jgi:hypothetical protein